MKIKPVCLKSGSRFSPRAKKLRKSATPKQKIGTEKVLIPRWYNFKPIPKHESSTNNHYSHDQDETSEIITKKTVFIVLIIETSIQKNNNFYNEPCLILSLKLKLRRMAQNHCWTIVICVLMAW